MYSLLPCNLDIVYVKGAILRAAREIVRRAGAMVGARGITRRLRGKVASECARGPFRCAYCGLVYKWRCNLVTHVRQKHGIFRRPACTQCGVTFRDMQVLARHTLRFHTAGARTLKCRHCPKKFKLEPDRRAHTRRVHGARERSYTCPHCAFTTTTKFALMRHIANMHPPSEGYACALCGHIAKNPRALQVHAIRFHSGVGRHRCSRCEASFTFKSSLLRHERLIHGDAIKWQKCCTCRKRFKSVELLKSHTRHVHSKPEDRCPCPRCEFVCKNKYTLAAHLANAHSGEEPYCQLCEHQVKGPLSLLRHMRVVHGVFAKPRRFAGKPVGQSKASRTSGYFDWSSHLPVVVDA